MKREQVKLTGIIVAYNEGNLLNKCLASLKFCDEIIVIDLGSHDNTVQVALDFGARVIHQPRVEIVEEIRDYATSLIKTDWYITLDPDEVLSNNAEESICRAIVSKPNIGVINIPWVFYFLGKRLRGTIWSYEATKKTKGIVCNKHFTKWSKTIHSGVQLLENSTSLTLPINEAFIEHYWVNSIKEMIFKHKKYLKQEGAALYERGERFSWLTMLRRTTGALLKNFLVYKSLKDGFIGVFLSFFYAWYVLNSYISLRVYQQEQASINRHAM